MPPHPTVLAGVPFPTPAASREISRALADLAPGAFSDPWFLATGLLAVASLALWLRARRT